MDALMKNPAAMFGAGAVFVFGLAVIAWPSSTPAKAPACGDSVTLLDGFFGSTGFKCAPGAVASFEGKYGKCTCIRSWADVGENAP